MNEDAEARYRLQLGRVAGRATIGAFNRRGQRSRQLDRAPKPHLKGHNKFLQAIEGLRFKLRGLEASLGRALGHFIFALIGRKRISPTNIFQRL